MQELSYTFINFLQSYRTNFGDLLFTALSFLGSEEFFLILFPLLYWVVDKRFTLRFALLFLLSSGTNELLKVAFAQPRPDAGRVLVLATEPTNGLPSGHAQNAVSTWGYIAYYDRQRWVVLAMLALIVGISLSRLYLGVHFIEDIVAGWFFGILFLFGFTRLTPLMAAWSQRQPIGVLVAVIALLPLLLIVLPPLETLPRAISAATGALWGCIADYRRLRFREQGATLLQLVLRLLLGMTVLLLIWRGLKPMLDLLGIWGVFLRYTLIGLWLTGGAPLLFVRLGLAQQEPTAHGVVS
jgi:membrane-associated phospholipid phosphatase